MPSAESVSPLVDLPGKLSLRCLLERVVIHEYSDGVSAGPVVSEELALTSPRLGEIEILATTFRDRHVLSEVRLSLLAKPRRVFMRKWEHPERQSAEFLKGVMALFALHLELRPHIITGGGTSAQCGVPNTTTLRIVQASSVGLNPPTEDLAALSLSLNAAGCRDAGIPTLDRLIGVRMRDAVGRYFRVQAPTESAQRSAGAPLPPIRFGDFNARIMTALDRALR